MTRRIENECIGTRERGEPAGSRYLPKRSFYERSCLPNRGKRACVHDHGDGAAAAPVAFRLLHPSWPPHRASAKYRILIPLVCAAVPAHRISAVIFGLDLFRAPHRPPPPPTTTPSPRRSGLCGPRTSKCSYRRPNESGDLQVAPSVVKLLGKPPIHHGPVAFIFLATCCSPAVVERR
jgi:hypothetical protein